MGRPYQRDLDGLSLTAEWADAANITTLVESIAHNASLPLVAIGSGGSRSVACLAAMLHRHYTGQASEETTPFLISNSEVKGRTVQIFTASGSNPDVLGCFAQIVANEPEALTVISSASSSPLSLRAQNYRFTEYFGFEGPVQGEGFVATNSILAQSILMTRAYEGAFGIVTQSVSALLQSAKITERLSALEDSVRSVGTKSHIIVLFGKFGLPAAMDLESKFSEVGLASVQLADFRNFAHGRHNWIDKHLDDTLVISIEIGDEAQLAKRTLHLLPPAVPVVRLTIEEPSTTGALLAMHSVMRMTGTYGKLRGLDPGRPGVPAFGSRLYRLNAWSSRRGEDSIPEISVVRKAQSSLAELRRTGKLDEWMFHFWTFIEALETQKFSALALDYDGTICDRRDRFVGVPEAMRSCLEGLLRKGIPIIVVTGRGRSVGEALRAAIPEHFWPSVRVAYYNGSESHPLDFTGVLNDASTGNETLEELRSRIQAHPSTRSLSVEVRRSQLTIATNASMAPEHVHRIVSDMIETESVKGARVVTSAHSVDLLLATASKLIPLQQSRDLHYLCIGDSGSWPGNDYELLAQVPSLSSHRTSHLLDRCWHISPAGWRNSQSTLHYLASLRHSSSGFQMDRGRLLSVNP